MTNLKYILFIDTETSGMPKHWSIPTSRTEKWPYILQVAWTICTWEGEKLATRNFYIDAGPVSIDPNSQTVHGITNQILDEKGIKRRKAMKLLAKDIEKYQPLIVGHFLEFDRKMMEVGFNRANVPQNFAHLPCFCTMLFSKRLRTDSFSPKFMRLNILNKHLFDFEPENQHDALSDALSTQACFFEMKERGLIDIKAIEQQQHHFKPVSRRKLLPYQIVMIILVLLALALFAQFIFILN